MINKTKIGIMEQLRNILGIITIISYVLFAVSLITLAWIDEFWKVTLSVSILFIFSYFMLIRIDDYINKK